MVEGPVCKKCGRAIYRFDSSQWRHEHNGEKFCYMNGPYLLGNETAEPDEDPPWQ